MTLPSRLKHTLLRAPACLLILFFQLSSTHAQDQGNKVSILNEKQNGTFPLVAGGKAAAVYFDTNDANVVRVAAKAFVEDIRLVTGATAAINSANRLNAFQVIIGTVGKSKLVDQLINKKKLNVTRVRGQWETFCIAIIDQPLSDVKQALVIAGSDPRGTAFGIFELSKMMGVSPFYWWADVVPEQKQEIFVTRGMLTSRPPSIKYRGIFINDEDWGLQPWAAKTFEPETQDIGPKTYARIFELLLRLKANLIWPAMHESTKAFFHYPGNAKVAEDYSIIIGTSHAEPMLRNNVGEWDEKSMGQFNYISNKERVYKYWEDRVKESSGMNAIYTMGMRGVHDSKMEGVKDEKEAVAMLERIIVDQRDLLKKYLAKDITAIPQVFTAYKEVLDIYDAGLKLPEDITLVWPDDNYGYIQRLNGGKESKRRGGSGVYYHVSYWGRPHDYLWLPSTHPSLVREEMMKAYENGSNKLWIVNVGDIKPLEYNIEQFLNMAYDVTPFKNSGYTKEHMVKWASYIFGKEYGQAIQSILFEYYQLAFERRPEFMGWSQTEPTTKTNYTTFNHFFYGDEAQRRIDRYDTLQQRVKTLRLRISPNDEATFYQLVYYPVVSAAFMNKKFLFRDKSYFYSRQNRLSARDYAQMSLAAHDSIIQETDFYNNALSGGKWKHIMSMKPRELPVFQPPVLPEINIDASEGWGVAPEGFVTKDSTLLKSPTTLMLPDFDPMNRQTYFIDLFLNDNKSVEWTASVSDSRIQLSKTSGILLAEASKNEIRIWVTVDWSKASKKQPLSGQVTFAGAGKKMLVSVTGSSNFLPDLANYKGFIENNRYVSIHASHFSRIANKMSGNWALIPGLGYTGECMESRAVAVKDSSHILDTGWIRKNASFLEYDFVTFSTAKASVIINTLPTHPLNNVFSMRYAVSVDGGPLQIVNFRTFGRSEEWKQNNLRNLAERKLSLSSLDSRKHVLRIYSVDPGVILQNIVIDLGGFKKAYGAIPETKIYLQKRDTMLTSPRSLTVKQ